jgi:hypothetical protein
MCGTRPQLPHRFCSGLMLYVPIWSYSTAVGSFLSCRATLAQSSNRPDIKIRGQLARDFMPHSLKAFAYVVNTLRTALRPTGVIVFSSSRLGTRPSFSANPWIVALISSLVIALSPVKAHLAGGSDFSFGPI